MSHKYKITILKYIITNMSKWVKKLKLKINYLDLIFKVKNKFKLQYYYILLNMLI